MISIKFLVENRTNKSGVLAEHGLAIYIEACGKKILFDAGSTDIIIENAERMGVKLDEIDMAVVSHGHYDHTGGFPAFCGINENAPIYIHRNAFREIYDVKDGRPYGKMSGIRWTDEQRKALEKRLVLTDGAVMIDEDICITGTLPDEEGFVPTEPFMYIDEDGSTKLDDMSHEQCLVIRQDEGLYVFSGCSHKGVVSAINGAKAAFPGEDIALLVAGMHLFNSSAEERSRVVEKITAAGAHKIIPVHCTGLEAICDLKMKMGDRCILASAGDSYEG